MKVALITTTIHPPEALYLLRKYGPDVGMFVALEQKVDARIVQLCDGLGAHTFTGSQYRCSDLIGWNCIQRRSVAILEALKWGADIIVSWDTDNLPLTCNYFVDFEYLLSRSFSGLRVDPATWFNAGALCDPLFVHRGFGHNHLPNCYNVGYTVDVRVGVAAGLALGDPDISAVDRISQGPSVHRVNAILDAGVVFDPKGWKNWTVFNTQNTAFLRELAPAMFCPPDLGRFDDIVASLVCQRVMRETDHVVHFGRPYAWQTRNPHDLVRDLKDELWGYENIQRVADYLDEIQFSPTADMPVADAVRNIYIGLQHKEWFPDRAAEAALAFCDDVEEILR